MSTKIILFIVIHIYNSRKKSENYKKTFIYLTFIVVKNIIMWICPLFQEWQENMYIIKRRKLL